jgi:hypothetical protein
VANPWGLSAFSSDISSQDPENGTD